MGVMGTLKKKKKTKPQKKKREKERKKKKKPERFHILPKINTHQSKQTKF